LLAPKTGIILCRVKAVYLLSVLIALAASSCGQESPDRDDEDAGRSAGGDEPGGSRSDAGDKEQEPNGSAVSCGDGVLDPLEQCDDANDDDEDGCTMLCEFTCSRDDDCDDNDSCNGLETCTPDHICLSGTPLEEGEACGPNRSCRDGVCVDNVCGDGFRQGDEECDDANQDDDDGCTRQCLFTCVSDQPSRDCANECDARAVCDDRDHTCIQGEPLPDGSSCDGGEGYCLHGVCTPLVCDGRAGEPQQLCEALDRRQDDAGVAGADAGDGCDPSDVCCTGDATPAGTHARSTAEGRTFLLYIPESLDATAPVALVLVHHGFTMSGQIMYDITSWKDVAEEQGLVVAYPNGSPEAPWNVGEGTVCGAGAVVNNPDQDDFGFVQDMIDDIALEACIDRSKVFVTGFSMGGYFSHNLACRSPDLVRATAPHSGGAENDYLCQKPRPVMILHGTGDPLISYDCAVQARDKWVQVNGCSTEVDTEEVSGGLCERNRDCPPGAQVEMCSFEGMGHGWAGSDDILYGGGSQYQDAARLAWRFFAEQLD
jgi:polyhydroxybutyrate depolymerase